MRLITQGCCPLLASNLISSFFQNLALTAVHHKCLIQKERTSRGMVATFVSPVKVLEPILLNDTLGEWLARATTHRVLEQFLDGLWAII